MKLSLSTAPLANLETEALVLLATEDAVFPEEKTADKLFRGAIRRLRDSRDFTGEPNKTQIIFLPGAVSRILLVGLGKTKDLTLERLRAAAGIGAAGLKKLPIERAALALPKLSRFRPAEVAQAITEGALLASYQFAYYQKPKTNESRLADLRLLAPKQDARSALAGLTVGRILCDAVNFVRDLGNHPANVATPTHLAEHARKIAAAYQTVKVKIFSRPEIKREKMEALLAVAKGSDEEPKFIVLEYRLRKTGPIVALVGKGITFDSGGISIKPGDKMEEMKFDMTGAATVMGIIRAAAELRLPLNLVGLLPATENLPSGKATRPGDVIRSRSGQTIEIVNTDAEGRLVLADALDYAKQYQPALVLDFATLTGAIVAALGDDLVGAFGNDEKLVTKLRAAGEKTGEAIWPMPLYQEYEQFIKSDIADLRNLGTTRYGDAINAANFLQHFVASPWIHLDIAGVAWATREKPYRPKGATGTGLRLAIEFLQHFKK